MNDRIPCAVSLAELAHDRGLQEFSPAELKEAREEIVDGIIGNTKGLDGVLLWHVLQSWLNVDGRNFDERLSIIAKHLQTLLNGAILERVWGESHDQHIMAAHAAARYEAREWLEQIVNDCVTAEQVEERAEKIAADRLEDSE